MMNLLTLCLVFTSLFAAEVWSPSPVMKQQPSKQQVEDVIEKEGHRVIVVETYDQNGQHNTKVSISPQQPQPQYELDGNIKFKSRNMFDNAKEKIEEAATDLPNTGHGISYGSDGEIHHPTELLCDALGKCTHGIAKVLNKATGKVSEVAHEVLDEKKELRHKDRDKVEDVYNKAKETASEKAHEAKEFVEHAYEKVKEKTAQKAQDVKRSAEEKAKDAVKEAKDLGKTIKHDIVHNITEKAEDVKDEMVEKVKEVKEGTRHFAVWGICCRVANSVMRYISEAMTSLMVTVNLLGFAIAYGMCVWVTFISSYVLAGALPRQQFGVVQSKIYPAYFTAMAYSIGLALLGHLLGQRQLLFTNKAEIFQAYNLVASVLVVLVNLFYLEPLATKAMFERMKIEKEEGRGRESPTVESNQVHREQPISVETMRMEKTTATTTTAAAENRENEEVGSRVRRTSKRLKALNSYSSFLNILTLMALTWHLVYLSQSLHLQEGC